MAWLESLFVNQLTRRALASQKMAERNANATSALNFWQVLPPVISPQFQMEPQSIGPMNYF
jgi:hypothetical protein